MASTVTLLVSAFQESEYFRTPVPANSLGFSDYTGMARDAETYFLRQALPTSGIIMAGVVVGAFIAARISRQFFVGVGAAFIVLLLSFALYVIACAATAHYLLEPASPLDSDALFTYSLGENAVAGVILAVFTASFSASASVVGAFM